MHAEKRLFHLSDWYVFLIGVAITVVAPIPLFTVIEMAKRGLTDDPNPNPVGPGILFFLGVIAGVCVMAIGIVVGVVRVVTRARQRRSQNEAAHSTR